MIRKVSLVPFAICTGVYTSSTEAIKEANEHNCSIIEITNGFLCGFVPVYKNKLITCRYIKNIL